MKTLLTIFSVLLLSSGMQQQKEISSYKVSFDIKNAGVTVSGTFKGLQADIKFDPTKPREGKIIASVAVNTISTGIAARDRHLNQEEYFDSKNYPRIEMTSTGISPYPGEEHKYVGSFMLKIKGKQKKINIPFTYKNNVFKTEFEINRRDFGVGGSSFLIGDVATVRVEVKVE